MDAYFTTITILLLLPFYGPLSRTAWVSWYQKKHSPTHTYPNHQSSFICFLYLLRSIASCLFNLHAGWPLVLESHGKSWNLGRPFSRPGKSWKTAKVIKNHGKVMENKQAQCHEIFTTAQKWLLLKNSWSRSFRSLRTVNEVVLDRLLWNIFKYVVLVVLLADRTIGRAYGTVYRLSVCRLSVVCL